ncbi:methylenetetrahydrofolate reductase [Frondihabitans sucicola]|uniref:Methylenetetrahydrofolate reductase n=1 Tax=Frondihabitans sucicola TaxID=1268041 RepID=A0ABN6XTU7_9MICO|nr:methylenetetrahydrofolate reductase [Frondihabitans sucicola]BDZ48432.1 methylenetetrahydrofolate reductase [Frondihabitans sucicola]
MRGVEFDGSCEVADHACVFLDLPTVRWARSAGSRPPAPEPARAPGTMRHVLRQRQVVVADFPARALSASSLTEVSAILLGSVDAVLAGDSGAERVQFSPAYRAALIQRQGLRVWSGLNCRDRNRVSLEGELASLADAGVAGVHCVTGDHTRTGSRPDARPVFDLDSTRLAALARAAGHLVSVAESPCAPPTGRRAERLVEKVRAGAEVCFVNHAGGAAPVSSFIREVQDLLAESQDPGAAVAFVPCVPLVVDVASARLLESFTTLVLPPGYLERILRAPDPFAEGVSAAVDLSLEMLALDGVRGVNLSGGAGPAGAAVFAEALAAVGRELSPTIQT